jgi:hypothetical protein
MSALAVLLTGVALLAACGKPPQPALTAPPEAPGSGSASALPPSGLVPGLPTAGLPTGGVPATGLPTVGVPTYPTAVVPTYPLTTTTPPVTPTTTRPAGPSPAPRCKNGPTAQQVLTVVKGRPGVPQEELKVVEGPYCSGTWQFSIVQIAGADDDDEALLVVTNGPPATIKVVEAGTDVCSVKVQNESPPGIRVRACGA